MKIWNSENCLHASLPARFPCPASRDSITGRRGVCSPILYPALKSTARFTCTFWFRTFSDLPHTALGSMKTTRHLASFRMFLMRPAILRRLFILRSKITGLAERPNPLFMIWVRLYAAAFRRLYFKILHVYSTASTVELVLLGAEIFLIFNSIWVE